MAPPGKGGSGGGTPRTPHWASSSSSHESMMREADRLIDSLRGTAGNLVRDFGWRRDQDFDNPSFRSSFDRPRRRDFDMPRGSAFDRARGSDFEDPMASSSSSWDWTRSSEPRSRSGSNLRNLANKIKEDVLRESGRAFQHRDSPSTSHFATDLEKEFDKEFGRNFDRHFRQEYGRDSDNFFRREFGTGFGRDRDMPRMRDFKKDSPTTRLRERMREREASRRNESGREARGQQQGAFTKESSSSPLNDLSRDQATPVTVKIVREVPAPRTVDVISESVRPEAGAENNTATLNIRISDDEVTQHSKARVAEDETVTTGQGTDTHTTAILNITLSEGEVKPTSLTGTKNKVSLPTRTSSTEDNTQQQQQHQMECVGVGTSYLLLGSAKEFSPSYQAQGMDYLQEDREEMMAMGPDQTQSMEYASDPYEVMDQGDSTVPSEAAPRPPVDVETVTVSYQAEQMNRVPDTIQSEGKDNVTALTKQDVDARDSVDPRETKGVTGPVQIIYMGEAQLLNNTKVTEDVIVSNQAKSTESPMELHEDEGKKATELYKAKETEITKQEDASSLSPSPQQDEAARPNPTPRPRLPEDTRQNDGQPELPQSTESVSPGPPSLPHIPDTGGMTRRDETGVVDAGEILALYQGGNLGSATAVHRQAEVIGDVSAGDQAEETEANGTQEAAGGVDMTPECSDMDTEKATPALASTPHPQVKSGSNVDMATLCYSTDVDNATETLQTQRTEVGKLHDTGGVPDELAGLQNEHTEAGHLRCTTNVVTGLTAESQSERMEGTRVAEGVASVCPSQEVLVTPAQYTVDTRVASLLTTGEDGNLPSPLTNKYTDDLTQLQPEGSTDAKALLQRDEHIRDVATPLRVIGSIEQGGEQREKRQQQQQQQLEATGKVATVVQEGERQDVATTGPHTGDGYIATLLRGMRHHRHRTHKKPTLHTAAADGDVNTLARLLGVGETSTRKGEVLLKKGVTGGDRSPDPDEKNETQKEVKERKSEEAEEEVGGGGGGGGGGGRGRDDGEEMSDAVKRKGEERTRDEDGRDGKAGGEGKDVEEGGKEGTLEGKEEEKREGEDRGKERGQTEAPGREQKERTTEENGIKGKETGNNGEGVEEERETSKGNGKENGETERNERRTEEEVTETGEAVGKKTGGEEKEGREKTANGERENTGGEEEKREKDGGRRVVAGAVGEMVDVGVDARDERQQTPLHVAAARGHLCAVTFLLEHGSQVDSVDVEARTPLHYAVESGEVEVVGALLRAGASTEVRERTRGRTPLHLATLANNLDILKLLLDPLIDNPWEARRALKVADRDGRTLLHLSTHAGLTSATELLLSAGAEVNMADLVGNTPLHAAILTRHKGQEAECEALLGLLLDAGGDVGRGEGQEAGTPLHAAAKSGCLRCLKTLTTRGAPIDAKDSHGRTSLQAAVEGGQAEAVKLLLELGASLETRDRRGHRALHHAILADSPDMVGHLLDLGAARDAKDSTRLTYFQFALLKRKFTALEALVVHGVTEVGEDQTVMQYCACVGSETAVDILLKNGHEVDGVDSEGRTALHHAICSGHEGLVLHLINSGSSISVPDRTGATPLHYAVRWGGSDAVLRRLVRKEGNVAAVDRLGRTPLHYAASKSSIMSDLYILLNNGAKLNTQDARGLTPLHLAARLGNESLVRILLDNDARHDLRDCDDFLPIDHAKENAHVCIIKRLEAYELKKQREKDPRFGLYTGKDDNSDLKIQSRYRLSISR